MNSFQLKILACIFMIADHVGAMIYTEVDILRIIGRLSFPIFAFLLTEGYLHTKNLKKYFIRLGVFAVFLQIPYYISFGPDVLNIFFTLFLGLLMSLVDDKIKNNFHKYILITMIALLSQKIGVDYGSYGVLLIYSFKKFKNDFKLLLITFLCLNVAVINVYAFQYYSIFSLVLIKTYNNKMGLNNLWVKYGFYLFYPIHLLIIYGISKII